MIYLSKHHGALGNQLFQYAYIRSQAKRLKTKFYFPKWIGDEIYNLNDQSERGPFREAKEVFRGSGIRPGFEPEAMEIRDETGVQGYFQSDKYFARDDVLEWFTLRPELSENILKKYPNINFSECTAIHLRIGDDAGWYDLSFYFPRKFFFRKALEIINQKRTVLIFSDEPERAKKYLAWIPGPKIFIEGNKNYEDLYLISLCQNVICSPSTFSWWGAHLNQSPDKIIVFPEVYFLPGARSLNEDIFVDDWIRLRAHIPLIDYRYVKFFPNTLRRIKKKILKTFTS
jgi:hypothetical protein